MSDGVADELGLGEGVAAPEAVCVREDVGVSPDVTVCVGETVGLPVSVGLTEPACVCDGDSLGLCDSVVDCDVLGDVEGLPGWERLVDGVGVPPRDALGLSDCDGVATCEAELVAEGVDDWPELAAWLGDATGTEGVAVVRALPLCVAVCDDEPPCDAVPLSESA